MGKMKVEDEAHIVDMEAEHKAHIVELEPRRLGTPLEDREKIKEAIQIFTGEIAQGVVEAQNLLEDASTSW